MKLFSLIALTIILFLTSCKDSIHKKGYLVHSSKQYENKMVNKVVVPKIIAQDSIIEIARKLKAEANWNGDFICYFYPPELDLNAFSWVGVAYKTDTINANAKDKTGARVYFEDIIPGLVSNKDLRALKASNFDRKNLIREIPDIIAKVKYEFYQIPGKSNEAVLVTLRPDGSEKVVKLEVKEENNIKRYVLKGQNIEGAFILEEHYMTIFDTENSTIGRTLDY